MSTTTKTGMGSHERAREGETNEWLTPPWLLERVGPFDLDPCSPINRPWDTATRHLTVEDDGLTAEWGDREFVWCNPPYGPHAWVWLERLSTHKGGGVALIFARTETAGFFDMVWGRARAVLFLRGRLKFHRVDGSLPTTSNAGAPSVLVAYGPRAAHRLRRVADLGCYMDLTC